MRSIPFLLLLFLGTDLFPNAIASPARSPPEPVLASLSPTSPSRPLNLFEKTFKFYSERHPVTSEAVKVDTSSIENEHKLAQSKAADQKGAADQPAAALNSTLHFENEASKAYEVGNNIPGISFPVKNSWAGLVPLDINANLTLKDLKAVRTQRDVRSLFFWLWGAEDEKGKDDLVIWLNGGPGCSSLFGFLGENGPIRWTDKTKPPRLANDSWIQEANVVWVEQPIATGFTGGTPQARTENDIASDLYAFLSNFYQIFPGLEGKRLWLTGESYAGRYIPFTADLLLSQRTNFNYQGSLIIDGAIADLSLTQEVVALDYILKQNNILRLNRTQVDAVKKLSDSCGYTGFYQRNLKFPPEGKLPFFNNTGCGVFDEYMGAAIDANKHFNIYKIDYRDPTFGPFDRDPLGDPNAPHRFKPFFARHDVQRYINAPEIDWQTCVSWLDIGPFPRGDDSLPPDVSVLSRVIEKSKKVIIANGDLDGLIITEGIQLSLQNLTWNGAQGFSKPPTTPLIGTTGEHEGFFATERGLTFASVTRSGHQIPQDRPPAGLALLRFLLGRGELSG